MSGDPANTPAADRRGGAGPALHLSVRDLACRRSGRLIFGGLGFDLGQGDALLVTGRNGAGKSTLLAILAGRLRAAAGRIALSGAGEATLPERLHWIAHRDGLKTALSARENLAFAAAMLGEARLAPDDALERGRPAAWWSTCPVAYLSAGQRRRVALARLSGGASPDLAPRRADLGPRCRLAADALRTHARTSRRGWHHHSRRRICHCPSTVRRASPSPRRNPVRRRKAPQLRRIGTIGRSATCPAPLQDGGMTRDPRLLSPCSRAICALPPGSAGPA